MAHYSLNVNGKTRSVEADADSPLLYVLRDQLELHGPKFGCGLAQCGACTVHIDGAAVRSCAIPAAIGNAVFDATGVRLRTVPFTPERVKAALARV